MQSDDAKARDAAARILGHSADGHVVNVRFGDRTPEQKLQHALFADGRDWDKGFLETRIHFYHRASLSDMHLTYDEADAAFSALKNQWGIAADTGHMKAVTEDKIEVTLSRASYAKARKVAGAMLNLPQTERS